MSTLYLDPGKAKDCSVAYFEGARLVKLDWCNADETRPESGALETQPTSILWEKPQIYPGKGKGNPNQLIDLAIAGAQAVAYLRTGWLLPLSAVRSVCPREWKGTISKPVHHMRLWEILSPAERALFPANTEEYIRAGAEAIARGVNPNYAAQCVDLLDAAALGCYDLGRLSGPLAGKVQAFKKPYRKAPRGKRQAY